MLAFLVGALFASQAITLKEANSQSFESTEKSDKARNSHNLQSLLKQANFHNIDKACESAGPGLDSLSTIRMLLQKQTSGDPLLHSAITEIESLLQESRCSSAEPLIRTIVQYNEESYIDPLDYTYLTIRTSEQSHLGLPDNNFVSILTTMKIDGLLSQYSYKENRSGFDFWRRCSILNTEERGGKDYEMFFAIRTYHAMGTLSPFRFRQVAESFREITERNPVAYPFTISMLNDLDSYKSLEKGEDIDLSVFAKQSGQSSNYWFVDDAFQNEKANRIAKLVQLPSILFDNLLKKEDAKFLSDAPFLKSKGRAGLTFAYLAYCNREFDNLRRLLKSGADVDAVLEDDVFPLVVNSKHDVYDPTFCPRRGETILLSAALDPFSKSDFLPLILPYTKKPDARDLLNRNALHRFLYHRVQEDQNYLIMLLIGAGADVNAKSVSGNTPCHVAVNRNAHLIKDLIGAGADFYAKNDRGETPMDLLKRSIDEKWIFYEKNAQVLKDLEERGLLKEKE